MNDVKFQVGDRIKKNYAISEWIMIRVLY